MAKKRKNKNACSVLKKTYRGTIRVDAVRGKIYITSAFYKACANIDSAEYRLLQKTKTQNPNFEVEQRRIATNPNKESFKGLTYSFMEKYIIIHEGKDSQTMKEYEELRLIGECHSIVYQNIKKWFLEKYPDVKNFTIEHLNDSNENEQAESGSTNDEKPIAA